MKGFIVCIALCLSLVSGASTGEDSKVLFKSHKFDKGEVINSLSPLWKDEVVYAVCEGSGAAKKCKVYVESTNQDKHTVQTCDLNLVYSGRFDESVILTNAGKSKAVFAVKDGETKVKLITVNLNGCQIKEASVDVSPLNSEYYYIFNFIILPHEKYYDVFFRNQPLCKDFFCKATFDYEGKLLKPASIFPLANEVSHYHQMGFLNNAHLVAQTNRSSSNVYLVKDVDNQSNITLYTGTQDSVYLMGLSAEESQLGFCAKVDLQSVMCRQYDAEGKTKKIEIKVPAIDSKQRMVTALDMLNLEKGFLAMSVGAVEYQSEYTIAVAHFDEHGKQGKTVTVDSKCDKSITLAQLYKNSNGQYCVNSMCMSTFDTANRSEFSHMNRCFLKTELF